MKKVLITGGFGYVGSRLTPLLLDKGYFVRVIDLNLYGNNGLADLEKNENFVNWKSHFEFIEGDIRDPILVEQAMQDIDFVIHLAAISNDPTGDIDEILTRQVNFDAVGLLISMAKKAGVTRFINASSSSVFGLKKESDITEALEPEPLTYYSKYKMLSEWLVTSASTENFITVNIRPATICGYSPRQRFDLTVNKLTADAVTKNLITVHGGQQRRPNVGMTDIINLYENLLKIDADLINGRTFNFGFENHKVIDIAEIIKDQLSDLNVEIKITETHDQRDYHISSSKILNTLNYNPVSSIKQEVKNLREALSQFENIDDDQYYNMKIMNLKRNDSAYKFLSR